jgi:predicted nucleotide-binding protein
MIELLQTEVELTSSQTVRETEAPTGQRVFLVHGHDEAVIHDVARFLERLDLDIIVLREQPNAGRTIIEKFVDYSDVGFAVVLLTADDRGGTVTAPVESQRPRARQNVIFELGYFLGKLGRKRVGVLYREGVEIPSDYSGVLFTPLDAGGAWRMTLARELKAAGFPIDMNKAV